MRIALVLLCLAVGCKKQPEPLRVAAASDLTGPFTELGAVFQRQSGQPVSFSFGSTGLLAKQIIEGAPFSLFAAANVSFVDQAIRAGACDPATKTPYARGRVGVWTPKAVAAPRALADLADARFVKIALANPEHAPYGRAAKEALEAAGLWAALQPKVVYAENIQQTLKFAQSGNVEAALVALSVAITAQGGHFLLVDDKLHRPLDQALVICGKTDRGAHLFAALLGSSEGRQIMKRYGFLLPGETTASAP